MRGAPTTLMLGQHTDDAPHERRVAGVALDRERLLALSAPAMEDLHRQLDSPGITVLLADSAGGVLRAIGAQGGTLPAGARPPATPQADRTVTIASKRPSRIRVTIILPLLFMVRVMPPASMTALLQNPSRIHRFPRS